MKCAICGGELVEGALCSTYAIWFYPLGADGKPGYDGRFRLRRTEEGFWSDFFTVAKARAQYCPSCKMVFAPVVRTDEDSTRQTARPNGPCRYSNINFH